MFSLYFECSQRIVRKRLFAFFKGLVLDPDEVFSV